MHSIILSWIPTFMGMLFCPIILFSSAHAATSLPFTVNLSENVTVTGVPRVAVDVGGMTRYATYTSGTGTSALTFTYEAVLGDVDLDGVALTSSIDLNGGTIKDAAGNDATLTFTLPNTSGINVNYPSLGMDFVYDADGRYTLNGTTYNAFPAFLTALGGSFSRASIGTYFDSAGVLQTAASGVLRFDYHPVTHAQKGALIEETRTNYRTYSSEMDNAIWTRSGVNMLVNNFTAPDGTLTAEKMTPTAGSSSHRIYEAAKHSVTSGNPYTASVFVKSDGQQYIDLYLGYTNFPSGNGATFDLNNGTITRTFVSTTPKIESIGGGWYRCSITVPATSNGSVNSAFFIVHSINSGVANIVTTADGIAGYYLWGAQYEQGAFPTSYIPTTSAAVTRQADSLTMPTGGWYNAIHGTLTTQSILPYLGGTQYPGTASIDDGTGNNAIHLFINDAGSDSENSEIFTGSVNQFSSGGAVYIAGSILKQGVYYNTNAARMSMNGTLGTLDSSVTIPSVTTLRVGARRAGSNPLNGWVQKVKYYPLPVADTQLQLLTQ